VKFIINIYHFWLTKVTRLMNAKSVLCTLIVSAFILGQIGTAVHAHEHEHQHEDETPHTVCEICILAVTDEDIAENLELPEILDGPDFLNLSIIMSAYRTDKAQLNLHGSVYKSWKPTSYDSLLDAARAPPLN